MFDIGAIRFELKNLLGIEVDVLTPNGLPQKFRALVLREAVAVKVEKTCCALPAYKGSRFNR